MTRRLGIVVLVRNRPDYALAVRAGLRLYTEAPFDLVFCAKRGAAAAQAVADAGELVFEDATAEAGLAHVEAETNATVFVVLHDHWMPTNFGWEREGIEGATRDGIAVYEEGAVFQLRGVWDVNEPFRLAGCTVTGRLKPLIERPLRS